MAKLENGYLGGFIGKLGNAVGYRWKSRWCVRSMPLHPHKSNTVPQQKQRKIFGEEVRLAGRMSWAVNIGLKPMSDKLCMTPHNVFVKINQKAFSLVDGQLIVDYPTLSISSGPVAPVALTEATVDELNVLNVKFDKNPLHLASNKYDKVFIWAWCPEIETGYLLNSVYRRELKASALLPSLMAGKELHVYAFVQDEQGKCSSTAYLAASFLTEALAPVETQRAASQNINETVETQRAASQNINDTNPRTASQPLAPSPGIP